MSSVAQIVRKIIDDLSDGVSELVLLVVVLAEQNAELPAQLPPASEIVNNTAKTLANIARELAKQDYAEFPEIAKEINEASDAVDSATGTMSRAVTLLQGNGDRKQGWNGLVDACRVMSGKTIRLLQIVYGADLKRLQLTADRLADDIDNINSHKDLSKPANQKKFADDIGGLTQKALKLANYVKDQAKDQDSPFSRDLLNKVAQGLKDKAQDLIDAGNLALQRPELAPKVDDALKALQDEIRKAKDAVNNNQPEAPALQKLKNLAPLLDRAEKSVADLPKVVKNNPNGYERAEKQMKDDVGDVIKNIKPNPKMNRPAEKLEEDLKGAILAARNALKEPTPQNQKAMDNAAKNLLDALNNLRKADGGKDISPEQLKEIQGILGDLRKNLNPDLLKKPEDKEQEAYERLKDNIDNLKKALRNGDPDAPRLFKNVAQNAKDLGNQMQNPDKKLPPYERQRKDDAGKDIENLLPHLIKKGTPALKNPKDEPAMEDLLDALRKLKRAADRGNKPKDERDLDDNFRDLLNNLKKARDAANGDKKDIDPALKAIQDALNNLRQTGDRLKERNPNPDAIEKPLRDIEDLANKFVKDVPNGAKGDKGALERMDKTIPEIQKAYDQLAKPTGAKDIRPIQDVEDGIDDVVAAVDMKNPSRIAPAGKNLNDKINDLDKFLNSHPDPAVRDFGNKVLDQIRPDFKDLIVKAKEAAQNPDKPGLSDEMNDIADRMKNPLAQLKKQMHPDPYDRTPEGAGAAVKKALGDLRKALKDDDPAEIRKALDNLRDALGKYNNAQNDAAQKHPDPKKRHLLDDGAKDIADLIDDVRRVAPTDANRIKGLIDEIPDKIDDWMDNLRGNNRDDALKAIAKANNLLATMGAIGEDDMDLGDLLKTAGQLSDLMRGLIGDAANTARQLGMTERELKPASQAALNLDKLLKEIEAGNTGAANDLPNTETISVNLPPPTWASTPEAHFEDIKLSSARTFDEVAAAIAREIHEQAKKVSQEGDNLARELANLARAARSGDKQSLLIAAKAASAHIIAFCKQINEVAAKMPTKTQHEKKEQDQMIKCAQALRNYGTQLKILASVKAASIESSRDTDESLSSLTRNLGEAVQVALKGMLSVKATTKAY